MPALIPVLLLAAGGSARLGRPKQLVKIDGGALLARAIRAARASGGAPVFVVLGAHAEEIRGAIPNLRECTVVESEQWQQGMSASLRAGLQAALLAAPETSGVLIAVCDQPAVTGEHLAKLIAEHERQPEMMIASGYVKRRGVPAVFPRRLFAELMALEGDAGARELLRSGKEKLVLVPLEGGEWDVDAEEDLRG